MEGAGEVSFSDLLTQLPEDIQAVFRYWDSVRGDRPMPRRADIDPACLVRFLSKIILVDVVQDQRKFVYRLVGTSEVEMRGADPTGKPVGDFCEPGDQALNNYDIVVKTKKPHIDADHIVNPRRNWIDMETIFLPLSEDGDIVNMILVYSVMKRI